MTPETYIPDPQRFVNHENQVIALEAMFIIVLVGYIFWKEVISIRKDKETSSTLRELTGLLNKIYGALHDDKR